MAIEVSREFEAELEGRLKNGRYRSAEELLREALHLVDERDEMREAVAQGAAEADRGEFVDGEGIIKETRTLIRHKAGARPDSQS
jgi:antitoxin ParD1/3/4